MENGSDSVEVTLVPVTPPSGIKWSGNTDLNSLGRGEWVVIQLEYLWPTIGTMVDEPTSLYGYVPWAWGQDQVEDVMDRMTPVYPEPLEF